MKGLSGTGRNRFVPVLTKWPVLAKNGFVLGQGMLVSGMLKVPDHTDRLASPGGHRPRQGR
jgi:hypothetical protein